MYDRFNRKITYLRISVTDRCNLRCSYCMPAEGIELKRHKDMLSFEEITAIARVAVGQGIEKIRLTGGEPLVRRGIVELVRQLGVIPGLKTLAMTTNGLLLPRYADQLRAAGLQAVNISLDTLDPDRYRETTRGGRLEDAVAGVDAAVAAGFDPIKINVVVPTAEAKRDPYNDLAALRRFCEDRGIILQKIGLYHLDHNKVDYEAFDRPPMCDQCNRLRLTADGAFKPCLHSNHEFPVDLNNIEDALFKAVEAKPFRGSVCTNRSMVAIGG
jgi:cyclic pyranopterin phosphate synthase